MVKEIIIDGIEVGECEHVFLSLLPIGNAKIKCAINNPSECKEFSNCIFKRNKRTEQKLAKALACIDKCVSDFYHEIGTPYYGELLKSARELGLIAEAKDE